MNWCYCAESMQASASMGVGLYLCLPVCVNTTETKLNRITNLVTMAEWRTMLIQPFKGRPYSANIASLNDTDTN